MISEASKRAKAKYAKEKTKRVVVAFYPPDAKILAWVNQQPNKAGYIKDLIRQDMAKNAGGHFSGVKPVSANSFLRKHWDKRS